MKKIAFFIYSLASGGAERVVSILLEHFSKKYETHLVLMNDTIFYEVPKNVKIHFLEKSLPNEHGIKKLIKIPFLAKKYAEYLEKERIDISISFMNRPNYINVWAKKSAKTIISERSNPTLQHRCGFQGFINRFLMKKLYKKADTVIANSFGSADDLKRNFNVSSVKVIYNPIKPCRYTKKKKNNTFTFITVGRLDNGKNHKMLIDAFRLANLDASLHIIGTGELKNKLKRYVESINLKEQIKFLGKQNNVFRFLNEANCFVFSSKHEGFPNVLLEALACNLPIISTDCQYGPREILAPDTDFRYQTKEIEFAECGILVPVNDVEKMAKAMEIIYNDSKLREKYAQKVTERAKDFDVKNIIKEWEKLLND